MKERERWRESEMMKESERDSRRRESWYRAREKERRKFKWRDRG